MRVVLAPGIVLSLKQFTKAANGPQSRRGDSIMKIAVIGGGAGGPLFRES